KTQLFAQGKVVPVPESFRTGKKAAIIKFQNPPGGLGERVGYPQVNYVVRTDLTEKQIKQVALGIFLDYQNIFETWQEVIGPGYGMNLSGWSAEDPFSDL